MAYPNKAVQLFSFLGFSSASPTSPLPGTSMDTEFGEVRRANAEVVAFLEGSHLDATGKLKSLTVNLKQLDATLVLALFGAAVPDLSAYETEIGLARDAAVAAQVAAETAETGAQTAETNAAASATAAASSAAAAAASAALGDVLEQYPTTIEAIADTIDVTKKAVVVLSPLAFYRRANASVGHSFSFRSADRFLLDGSTDATNGGYWELDQNWVTSELAVMAGDGLSGSAAANATGMANAIAYLANKGGGTLVLGHGAFNLNAATAITANGIEIRGQGIGKTTLDYVDATTTNGIQSSGAITDTRIRDLTVKNADLHGISIINSGANKPERVTLSGVEASNNVGDGFHLEQCSGLVMDNCIALSNTLDGFDIKGYAEQVALRNCRAASNSGEGFRISDIEGALLTGCISDSNTVNGFNIEKFIGLAEACSAGSNTLSGFLLTGNTGGTVDGVRLLMLACTASGNDSGGAGANFLEVVSTAAAVVIGFKFCRDTTATGGISTADTGANTTAIAEANSFAATDNLSPAAAPFTKSFTSSDQTITAAGALTLAHSLGASPTMIQASLICQTAELGYSVADEVFIDPHTNNVGGSNQGHSIVPDATNLNVRFGGSASTYKLIRKDTGNSGNVINANWKLRIRAWV